MRPALHGIIRTWSARSAYDCAAGLNSSEVDSSLNYSLRISALEQVWLTSLDVACSCRFPDTPFAAATRIVIMQYRHTQGVYARAKAASSDKGSDEKHA